MKHYKIKQMNVCVGILRAKNVTMEEGTYRCRTIKGVYKYRTKTRIHGDDLE